MSWRHDRTNASVSMVNNWRSEEYHELNCDFFVTLPLHRGENKILSINLQFIYIYFFPDFLQWVRSMLRWSRGSVLALSTQVREFKSGRSRQDFLGRKKSSARRLGKITGQHFRPQFYLSLLGSLASYSRGGSWRRKCDRLKSLGGGGQGLQNKPIDCGASGVNASGPDEEEEAMLLIIEAPKCNKWSTKSYNCAIVYKINLLQFS